MLKRFAMVIVLCLLLLLPTLALATEGAEDTFEGPTRNPHAPEYSTDHPEQLVVDQIVARSFILMERSGKEVLFEKDSDLRLFPASTTKVMTALIALQVGNLDDELVVSANAVNMPEDASMVPFKTGEVVTLRDALYGLMLRSGNDAAIAIAEYVAGDVQLFVDQMNEVARMLGCDNTNFTNPHGYHDEWHQTTARDLATILDAALENETFREIIASVEYTLSQTMENPARKIYNSNLHIHPDNDYYYQFSIGGKTGFTNPAGYVLVEAAENDGVELIAVAMYSNKYSRWPDTSRLFQYGFTQYKSVTPEEIYEENRTTLQINGFSTEDKGLGRLELDIKAVDPGRKVRFTDLSSTIDSIVENYSDYTNIKWLVELRAPIEQGQVMGIMTFYPPNEDAAEYELIASRSVPVRTDAPPTLEEIEARVLADPSPFPPFSWDWVLPPVLILLAFVIGIHYLIKAIVKRRRKRKRIPLPKKRSFR